MHRILHALRRAVDALVRAPYVTVVAVGTIYVALLVTGALAVLLGVGGQLLSGWARQVPISVYLAPDADLEAALRRAREIAPDARFEVVTSAEAIRRLRASLGDQGRVLDGLADDALPASVEVQPPTLSAARARVLATQLRAVPGSVEVDDGAVWVARLEELVRRGRQVAGIVLALLALATAVLVSNTLKLAVYARRDEIEIMKLVGATDLYVGAPILLEGVLQGLLGAGLAVATLAAATLAVLPRARDTFSLAARLGPGDVLTGPVVGGLLLAGVLLGLVSSAISLRRFLRRPAG